MNAMYFKDDATVALLLDPINGTKMYKDQCGHFDIILSIVERGEMTGAVTYIPNERRFYLAANGSAFQTQADSFARGVALEPYQLPPTGDAVLTYKATAEEVAGLRRVFPTVVQMDRDYNPRVRNFAIHDVLTGRAGAFIRRNAPLIDSVAISLIAVAAGGVMCDYEGMALSRSVSLESQRLPSLICAKDATTADNLVKALRERGSGGE